MVRARGLLAVVVVSSALGCPAQAPVAPPQPPTPAPKDEPVVWTLSKTGLGFRLSDADPRDDKRPPPARATRLADADAKRVLDRLPPMKEDPSDAKDFALRDRSKPAPRAGATLVSAFPPPEAGGPPPTPSARPGAPLTVTRKQPTGAVELAPALTVSFSQPMVAVTSHDDLAKTPPPVVLTPTPPGKWRWVGAQTVVFDPEKRFPMATEYKVEVPAGTRAANGQVLAQAESWTFTTPPPKLVRALPDHGPQHLDPVLYAEFDQAVDSAAILASMRLEAGSKTIPVRLATEAEIAGDPDVRLWSGKAQPGRWLAFKADGKLPAATSFVLRFPEGTPSAEGPRRTTREQHRSFYTFHAMDLVRARCGWDACAPAEPWTLQFTNPIDTRRFDPAWVKISPEPASYRVDASGNAITIRPRSKGKTKYTVTVDGALADTFGQTMGKAAQGEITVAPADPFLFSEERPMSVLDPAGGPVLPVFSVNRPALDVRLYAVAPEDWPAYERWRRDWDYEEKTSDPPGRLVVTRRVTPDKLADELVTTPIDLAPALNEGVGQVLVVVEPTGKRPKARWERQWVRAWVQVTKLGVQAAYDSDSVTAWCSDLATGAPAAGVSIALGAASPGAVSDASGLARVDLLPIGAPYLVARRGKDLAFLPELAGASRHTPGDVARWLVFDDRKTYKPGEEVRVKGWLRKVGLAKGGDVAAIPDAAGTRVSYVASDARGVEIGKGEAKLDASGGFDLALKLPATPNLGHASIRLTAEGLGVDGRGHVHTFDVQEFRRPEFEVTARAGEGPHFVGRHTNVTVSASYYAGGGLPNADVGWKVFRSDARFVPPNRADFAFGKAEDWWWRSRGARRGARATGEPETFPGRTGPSGEHRVRVDFDALDPAYPMSLRFEGTVTDVNRQAWTGTTNVLVHPADVYVGVRQARAFVKGGEPFAVDVLVADLDGHAVAGRPVTVRSARVDWAYAAGEPVEVESDVATCTLVSGAEPQPCALATKEGGRYRLTAVVTDRFDRKNQTETHFWVLGDRSRPDDTLERGKVELIPSKPTYAPGELAELLVVAPFAPAEGLLTIRRQGVVHTSRFQLASTTQAVTVKVDPTWLPNATAHVALVGAVPREDARGVVDPALPKRPAFAEGSTQIQIPPRERTLAVTAKAREDALDPGGSTTVEVDVRDAAGAPVAGSTAAVVVVDEAILALSAYATPDPLAVFYSARSADTRGAELRAHVLVARAEDKQLRARSLGARENGARNGSSPGLGAGGRHKRAEAMPAPAARAMASAAPVAKELANLDMAMLGALDDKPKEPEKPGKPIALRAEFGPLALFAPTVVTDANGHASVAVKLPDSLTRYRVMAVAVAGERQFGSGEGRVTARLPLMVRPSAPRFLNFGDRFELPIVLQNQTSAPLEVDLAARAANAELVDGAGRRVTVPANDRVEVRLPAAAARVGTARFQVGAASGAYADAASIELPVWTPATTEAFATYGTIDDGAVAQPVKMPSNVVTQFGGLEITTSSTALSSLTDAVLYLVRYPFECNEQISSRVLAVAALRDVLSAFNPKEMPTGDAMAASMKRDIEKLRARQHWSGGWDFWRSDREPWPYLSAHVTHALVRAKEKGFDVPKAVLDGAQRYLRSIDGHIPGWYSPESRRAIVAYALYVRHRMKDGDPARVRKLVAEAGGVDKLGLEAIGWIWPTLLEAGVEAELADIRKHIQNRVSETAGAAHFATSYADGAYVLLHSDRRADGILLEALIADQPKSDLIPKLVGGLLNHRKAGRWLSTQENAFVLLALDRYFATYEKATPDFVARAWLGDRFAGEHAFKGRSADRHEIDVPMSTMAEVGSADLVLSKTGPGRLYYRVGMSYAPADLRPPPAEHGFTVTRQYEPVDDPADVKRDADGTWRVKAGAKVRVRVTMVVPSRRYHVALVDPLPAGLEPMNPAIATTGTVPADPNAPPSAGVPWWWRSTWYEHQNLRDERVEAFASLVWDGVYDYTYVARATTPGSFVAPPPKAEEMYAPETFGRGAGDRVVVE